MQQKRPITWPITLCELRRALNASISNISLYCIFVTKYSNNIPITLSLYSSLYLEEKGTVNNFKN